MKRTLLFIPHYNDPKGLDRSLNSIQNDADLDLLIIDDGSQKIFNINVVNDFLNTKKISFKILIHESNKGITATRNHALEYFKRLNYEYLMFLDCGDIMAPERVSLQLSFLDKNKDCMIVGSYVHFVDEKGTSLFKLTLPIAWRNIKQKMYFNSMLIQPAVTLRAALLKQFDRFPSEYDAAEDYAFFMAVSQQLRVDNIPKFLTTTFINTKGISNTKRKKQVLSRIRIILKHFKFGYYPIIGLLRSCILLFIPLGFTARLKGLLYFNESKS